MTSYEKWSLIVTALYDLLTFGLLAFVAYQTVILPRVPKLALHIQRRAPDTKNWSWEADLADFVLENRGSEISNVRITSEPDDLGWQRLTPGEPGRKTSENFPEVIPYLGENDRRQLPWCSLQANQDKVDKPFRIRVEYDHPFLPCRRSRREFKFNLMSFRGTRGGFARRYDEHNIAQECARIREQLEALNKNLSDVTAEALRERPSEDEESG
jgi:hypothetical protein